MLSSLPVEFSTDLRRKLILKQLMYKKIILFIPHSSDKLDKSLWCGDIDSAVNKWTDWHTDKLFSSIDKRVQSIIVPFSRFHCDAERLVDDPMENIGQGIAYRSIEGCTRSLSDAQISDIQNQYTDIHEGLERMATDGSIIIDCHSFPSNLSSEIDICIGFNDDDSKPSDMVLQTIVHHFENAGFRVGVNNPYSNAMRVGKSIPSFMIEFNKRVYLNQDERTPNEDFDKINTILNQLYIELLED